MRRFPVPAEALPPGAAILSTPFVALMNATSISATDTNDQWSFSNELFIQTVLASLLMAGLTLLIYKTARAVLPQRPFAPRPALDELVAPRVRLRGRRADR